MNRITKFLALVLSALTIQIYAQNDISKVTPCNAPVTYCVNDILLKGAVGQGLAAPDTNPVFIGGIDVLKKYFDANSLTDEKAKDMVFRVYVGFTVNCKGTAGDFFLATKGDAELEGLANQVLAIVNKMPQKWKPAVKNGKPVDCYQVLSFTVSSGSLGKVSYR